MSRLLLLLIIVCCLWSVASCQSTNTHHQQHPLYLKSAKDRTREWGLAASSFTDMDVDGSTEIVVEEEEEEGARRRGARVLLCPLLQCGPNAHCLGLGLLCGCNDGYSGLDPLCIDRDECSEGISNCTNGAVCQNTPGSYICKCPTGYNLVGGNSCTDINECAAGANCGSNKVCVNTPGSYRCDCASGYADPLVTGTCSNINECLQINICPLNALCQDTIGSYSCPCLPGFNADNGQCSNINECLSGANNCSSNGICADTLGSFTCSCPPGFSGNGYVCNNINECQGQNNCSTNANCYDTIGSYTCSCKTGYTGDGKTCTDINECDASPCGLHSTCENTVGSYNCGCQPGYTKFGVTCVDVDECFESTDNCSANGVCLNTPGGFTCNCPNGFSGNGYICTDDNECALNTDNCSPNAQCINTIGNYSCTCKVGYSGDGYTCNDIDECDAEFPVCGLNSHCQNNIGSYTCPCNNGYSGNPCLDINECLPQGSNTCTSNETCVNNPGSYTCECYGGRDGNGACQDENECLLGTSNCTANADCTNILDGFTCACSHGYTGNGYTSCTDVNECSNPNICGDNAYCNNTAGSYTCTCNSGFDLFGVLCVDIDECSVGTANCHAKASCQNTPGHFTCSCLNGYEGDGTASCIDINECQRKTANCSAHATCTNTPGSYKCACKNGFSGNGLICNDNNECDSSPCGSYTNCQNTEGSYTCSCLNGFTGTPPLCIDNNECLLHTDNCTVNQTCSNSIGSFSCSCAPGFEQNGQFCTDINECVVANDCGANSKCTNTIGGRTCSCLSGYDGNPYLGCVDINECLTIGLCGANSVCTNKVPGYTCGCALGFSGNPCKDKNECLLGQSNCTANQTCINNIGSFTCPCSTGFRQVGPLCLDIDECLEGSNNCDTNALCANSFGSYTCKCKNGFTGNGTFCEDVDECKTTSCGENTVCQNSVGSFQCLCASGFSGTPPVCVDINECLLHTSNCSVNSTCVNTNGNYTCDCRPGFSGNGYLCLDINECAAGATCAADATCYNKIGNYTCICNLGFTGDGYQTCSPAASCASSPCGAHSSCTDTGPGTFDCDCQDGYDGIPPLCLDINECLLGTDNCNGTCFNTEGSFECNCPPGYHGNGITCIDDNECDSPNACQNNAVCVNIPGSFLCLCASGFNNSGSSCDDIDECATFSCGTHTICNNTVGSFTCGCAPGYTGTAPLCIDRDECLLGEYNCNSNQTCRNTDGGYDCNCGPGFSLIGGGCSILNECFGPSDCGLASSCLADQYGYMSCVCDPGYIGIPPACIQIPTCISDNDCASNETCAEYLTLHTCQCKPGFLGLPPICLDPNACESDANCGSTGACSNFTLPYSTCACKSGYTGIYPLCLNLDSCEDNAAMCGQHGSCTEVLGEHHCACDRGYFGIPPLCVEYPPLSVAVSGPAIVSPCSIFTLVASVSGIVDNDQISNVNWSIIDDGSFDVAKFNAELQSNPTTSTRILIVSDSDDILLLLENKEYTFQVEVTDALNRTFISTYNVTRGGYTSPTVIINAPPTLSIRANAALTLSATLVPSSCSIPGPVVWSWYIGSQTASTNRVLQVAAGSLSVGTYIITLSSGYQGYYLVNASIQVTVLRSDVVARISIAGNRTLASDKPLTLDSSTSYDPDLSALAFAWTCTNLALSAPCLDVNGQAVVLDTTAKVTIPAGTLASDTYMFVAVVIAADGRSANTSTFISIVPSGSISVSVKANFNYKAAILQLAALTDAPFIGTTYSWTSPSLALDSHVVISTSTSLPTLALSYASLPGGVYTFTVTVSTAYATATSSITVTLPNKPSGSSCTVSPSSGEALTTTFTLECSNFGQASSNDSLRYVFGYELAGKFVWLDSAHYSSSIQTFLPAPPQGNTLKLIARVIGAAPFYAKTTVNFTATISLPVGLSLKDQLTIAVNQYDASGDQQTLYQDLTSLSAVAAAINTPDTASFQSQILPVFVSASSHTQTNPDSDTSQYDIAQSTSVLSYLTSNIPAMDYSLTSLLTAYLNTTVYALGDQLIGSPTEDLISTISSLITAAQAQPARKRADTGLSSFTPILRDLVVQLAGVMVSDSVCGQAPANIETPNIQMAIAKVFFTGQMNITGGEGRFANGLPTTVMLPSNLFSSHATPDCIETHIVTQSAIMYDMQDNSSAMTINTTRQISDVQSVTVLKTGSENNKRAHNEEYSFVDLPTPILIDIPIGDPSVCNASAHVCSYECRFYNTSTLEWDTRGCKVASVTKTHVQCSCNHLTDFLVMLRSGVKSLENTGSEINDADRIFSNPNSKYIIIQVVVLWVVFIIAVLCAIHHDRKLERITLMSSPSQVKLMRQKPTLKEKFWEKIKNDHRWLCVFYRTAETPYSTARRVSVVFLVMMTSFAANAIFYEQRVYHYKSFGEKLLTAFWSAIIVVPINLLVIFILKRSASIRRIKKRKHSKYDITSTSTTASAAVSPCPSYSSLPLEFSLSTPTSSPPVTPTSAQFPAPPFGVEMDLRRSSGTATTALSDSTTSPTLSESNKSDSSSDGSPPTSPEGTRKVLRRYPSSQVGTPTFNFVYDEPTKEDAPNCLTRFLDVKFKWWMEVVGYVMWFLLVGGSTFLVLLYGLDWETTLLNSWFLSSWISILQDVLFNQPLFNFVSAVTEISVYGKVDFVSFFHKMCHF